MTLQVELQIAIAIGNLGFLAGLVWFLLKQLKHEVRETVRQVNGVGAKVRELQAREIADEESPEKRAALAQIYFGAKR